MNIKVHDGTPVHEGKGLCNSCKHSHVYRSGAESEVTVLCTLSASGNSMRIKKPVVECSEYCNKTTKSLWDMEKIAWVLATKNGKPIGFLSAREARKKQEDNEIDNVEIE